MTLVTYLGDTYIEAGSLVLYLKTLSENLHEIDFEAFIAVNELMVEVERIIGDLDETVLPSINL